MLSTCVNIIENVYSLLVYCHVRIATDLWFILVRVILHTGG